MNALSAILIFTASATISPGQSASIEGLQGLDETRHHIVESDVLDKQLHIFVGRL